MKHVTLLDTEGIYRNELLNILQDIDAQYTVIENFETSDIYDSDLVILVCKYDLAYISSDIENVNERFLCIMYDIPDRSEPRLYTGARNKYIYFYFIYEINDEIRDELKLIINGVIDRFNRRLGKRHENTDSK